MDLDDVALFRAIASSGSLSEAGRQLGLAPMAVSRRLAALETALGTRLFHRTTRSISLTAEGEAFLPHAIALLDAQDAALASLASGDAGLTGVLKITAPNVIGHSVVVPVVADLLSHNPMLSVDIALTDNVVDLAAIGLDVAIRVSPLEPSDMIASKLAHNPRVLCASPAYIARFGKPSTIADLISHPCIKLQGLDTWPFKIRGEIERIRVSGPFSANTVDAVRSACLSGVGIAMMTYWDVLRHLSEGELERIELRDAELDNLGIWAVFPTRKHMPARVRAFIDALRERLSSAAFK